MPRRKAQRAEGQTAGGPKIVEVKTGTRNWAYVPSGMPVWAVIGHLKSYDWDIDRTLKELRGAITDEDMKYALEYYQAHKEEIDCLWYRLTD